MLALEIVVVAILTILNGLFALSELAVVSSRRSRLQTMANQGVPGAATALTLAGDPGKFLSTVQIGITLIGVLSGAFSGSTLGVRLAAWLADLGLPAAYADPIGIGIVVVAITYISVIIGELVPKQLALRDPERFAVMVAPAMSMVARVARPLVAFFDYSGRVVLRLMGLDSERESSITDEEIRALIAEAETAGVIEPEERSMIAGVMRLGDRAVRAVMTPRTDVDWINLQADDAAIRKLLMETQHSRLPAGEGVDAMVGVVQTRDMLAALLAGRALDIGKYVRPAPIVHDQADALDVLAKLKESDMPMALVHDEYGHFEGIVTPADILEAITGVFRSDLDAGDEKENAVKREDGSWLLAGYMQADEMADLLGIDLAPHRDYETVAGHVLSLLHHLPATGETVEAGGWRFEVVDMDGRRIDKVIATRLSSGQREA